MDKSEDESASVELPPCEQGRLQEISEMTQTCLTSQIEANKLAVELEREDYIHKLLLVFRSCEDLGNIEGLHQLYTIFKHIFMLNKRALFQVMFAEDIVFDVVGCLEYDPACPTPKRHREYLRNHARFKEVVPITNPELLTKIHQTYRVQYIQDVVSPPPALLASFIYFNRAEIVTLIQDDDKFLNDLFVRLFETTSEEKRRDLVMLLKEICNFSENLQPHGKEDFYKTLSTLGLMPALMMTLRCEDEQTKAAAIDILTHVVKFSPSVVRAYTLKQAKSSADQGQTLLNVIIEQMICDADPELGGAEQLVDVLSYLLDPDKMPHKREKTDFLNYFYKHSIHLLLAPLLNGTASEERPRGSDYRTARLLNSTASEERPRGSDYRTARLLNSTASEERPRGSDYRTARLLNSTASEERPRGSDYRTARLLELVLELLTIFVQEHAVNARNCILNNDLLRKVLVLMRSKHTFLVLGALRVMRTIVAMKDELFNRYIIRGNLFAPVVDAFFRNNNKYNMMDSAILDIFELINVERIKSLCLHVVEKFGDVLDKVDYVQTFKVLRVHYEQHQNKKMRDQNSTALSGSVPSIQPNLPDRDPRQRGEDALLLTHNPNIENSATAPVGTQTELSDTQQFTSLLKKHTVPNVDLIEMEPKAGCSSDPQSSRKRKHDEGSSEQPQKCRVLQIANSHDLPAVPEENVAAHQAAYESFDRPSNTDKNNLERKAKCRFCGTEFPTHNARIDHVISNHPDIKLKSLQSHSLSLNPKPCFPIQTSFTALEAFYVHFCKFHLQDSLDPAITIPHLIQNLKANRFSTNCYKCARCPSDSREPQHSLLTRFNTYSPTSDINFERCKICLWNAANLDVKSITEHLETHRYHYCRIVKPGAYWKCVDCERLSSRCLLTTKSFHEFQLKNIVISKFKYSSVNAEKTAISFKYYFSYKFNESLPELNHNQKCYSCIHCSDTFVTQSHLHLHLESHVDFVFRKCSLCQLQCDSMDSYYDHITDLHGPCLLPDMDLRNMKVELDDPGTGMDSPVPQGCDPTRDPDEGGALVTPNQKSARSGVWLHGTYPGISKCSSQILTTSVKFVNQSCRLQCPICNVVFLDQKLFHAHCVPYTELFTTFPWRCIFCSLNFGTEVAAIKHWKDAHSITDTVYCRICNVRQKTTVNLKHHVSQQHNVPMIHCSVCKCNILFKKYALNHFKDCYSQICTFVCPVCGFICENFNFLMVHLRVELETLTPRYQCKCCLNFFHAKLNLVSHMLHGKCKHYNAKRVW